MVLSGGLQQGYHIDLSFLVFFPLCFALDKEGRMNGGIFEQRKCILSSFEHRKWNPIVCIWSSCICASHLIPLFLTL